MKLLNIFVNLLFPKKCVNCGKTGSYLCYFCTGEIRQTDLVCPMCERASFGGITHPVCRRRYGLDGLWSLGIYQDPLRKVIQKLKYKWVTECANSLVDLTLDYWVKYPPLIIDLLKKDLGREWLIVPVPLHAFKQNKRGFNQSALLGSNIAKKLGLEYRDCLIRIINTKPQVSLSLPDRRTNIKGAFKLKDQSNLEGKSILLIDDVWTTGSTLKECAYILKRASAKRVWALTLAR
jgi:competence protein ComFC